MKFFKFWKYSFGISLLLSESFNFSITLFLRSQLSLTIFVAILTPLEFIHYCINAFQIFYRSILRKPYPL